MARLSVLTILLCVTSHAFSVAALSPVCLSAIEEGQAAGQTKNIDGIQTYLSFPANNKTDNAILYLTDIFGLPLLQNRRLADSMARAGYFVVMPDILAGDAVSVNGTLDLSAFGPKHPVSVADGIIDKTIKTMRQDYGVKRIGAVGYCFGGRYAVRVMAQGKGVDAAFTAHPSMLAAGEMEAVAGPLSIAAAETDGGWPDAKRRESEEVLKKKGVTYQSTLYSGVEHGFAVRVDMKDRKKRFAKEAAFVQAVRWFDEWVKQ